MEGNHNPNQLVVEGQDDLFAIVGLMRAHVDWPEGPGSVAKAPVFIHNGNGAAEILKDGFLGVFLKNPVLRACGVVLDADTNPRGRYQSILHLCADLFPKLPPEIPPGGVVVENVEHQRFGVWIMPDNSSDGSLETFLKWLVPTPSDPLWDHSENSVKQARELGAQVRDAHLEKANLYTWLAWQDPPGQSPGIALAKRVLEPQSPNATAFVNWFMELFQLPPRTHLFS